MSAWLLVPLAIVFIGWPAYDALHDRSPRQWRLSERPWWTLRHSAAEIARNRVEVTHE